MRKPTIALAIPHAAHRPERVASLTCLREALTIDGSPAMWTVQDDGANAGLNAFQIFADREPYVAWATKVWRFLEDSGCDWGLQLQDDTRVSPNFWRALRAMLAADVVPERDVICLESANPTAPLFHQLGDPWFTTSDMLIGNAYLARHATYRDFRDFREVRLKPGAFDGDKPAITEDTLFGIFCMLTGRKIWCPTVTIVDHDLSVASTCGNDAHPNRRPRVRWDNAGIPLERFEDPAYWKPTKRVPHIGRAYGLSHHVARQWVKDVSPADFERMNADDGRQELVRAKAEMRIVLPPEFFPAVMIATPSRGTPCPEYMQTVWALQAKGAVEIAQPYETAGWWYWRDDIVRVRSRMGERFRRSRYTHLFFVDDDVSFDSSVLEGMLAADRDMVVCPYPSKKIDWASLTNTTVAFPEARGLKFDNVMPLDGSEATVDRGCVEIKAAGLGCALITRKGYERLVTHLREEAHLGQEDVFFDDEMTGPTCFAFAMRPSVVVGRDGTERRSLLSEDLSFCARWRESGQKIWMYVGPGAPASHHGTFTFRGLAESLQPPKAAEEWTDKGYE